MCFMYMCTQYSASRTRIATRSCRARKRALRVYSPGVAEPCQKVKVQQGHGIAQNMLEAGIQYSASRV